MIQRAARHLREHLTPTRKNGFIPRLLHEQSIFAMLGIGIALFSFVQFVRINNYFGLTAEVYPAVVFTLTNNDRASNSLTPLTFNKTLEAAAKLKAQDMLSKGYFAHTSPEGVTPWYWFGQAGYKFIYAGENLAINFNESDTVQKAWLNSPTHRANIMNENFTEIGIAAVTGTYRGQQTTFVVELFGMPATARTGVTTPPVSSVPTPVATSSKVTTSAPVLPLVAGEVAQPSSPIKVLEETEQFVMAQNTDKALEPGNPVTAPEPTISFFERLLLKSDKIAGLIIEIIIIGIIISLAGMVAREYEKHHKKHMVYGSFVAVIMFAFLFVGGFGVFSPSNSMPVADTSSLTR